MVVLRADYTIASKRFARSFAGTAEEVRDAFARAPGERAAREGDVYRFAAPIRSPSGRGEAPRPERELGHLLLGLSAASGNAQLGTVRLWLLALLACVGPAWRASSTCSPSASC